MFNFGFKKSDRADSVEDLGNSPTAALMAKAARRYAELYGSHRAESSRWFIVSVVLLIAVIFMAGAIATMMPLKTIQPFMVGADSDHNIIAKEVTVKEYKPDQVMISYFLTKWIEETYSLDPYTIKNNLHKSFAILRDKAVPEYTDFINSEKPIVRLQSDPNLNVIAVVTTMSPGDTDGIVFADFTTRERSGNGAAVKEQRYRITIHYVLVPPTTEAAIRENPLGLYITHFNKATVIN